MNAFETTIEIRWADVDQNGHLRHSAYYDLGAHCRIKFFTETGFKAEDFAKLNIGPILFKEEATFLREIHPDDNIRINLKAGDMREDGSRWVFHHELYNEKGELCAYMSVKGAWLDLIERKLTAPPAAMAEAMQTLPKGDYFVYQKAEKSS